MARTKRGYISTGGGPRSNVKKANDLRKVKDPTAPCSTPPESKMNKAPAVPRDYKTYIPFEDYTWHDGDSEPLIETYEECKRLTVPFASSPSSWFFAYCKSAPCPDDDDDWTFPAGYYLAKKCTDGARYYLSYLRRYRIDGKWHNFNEFVDGGGRMEQITSPNVFVANEFASMYTVG